MTLVSIYILIILRLTTLWFRLQFGVKPNFHLLLPSYIYSVLVNKQDSEFLPIPLKTFFNPCKTRVLTIKAIPI